MGAGATLDEVRSTSPRWERHATRSVAEARRSRLWLWGKATHSRGSAPRCIASLRLARTSEVSSALCGVSGDGVAYFIHEAFDQVAILSLAHHPNDRLGPRRADDEPPSRAELVCRGRDGGFDRGAVERGTAPIAHAPEDLRQRVEAMANFAHRLLLAADHGQDLQGGHQTVAGRRIVRQDDMSGLLAPDVIAELPHPLEDIAIANRRALQSKSDAGEMALQRKIGHDRGDDARLRQPPVGQPTLGHHGHELIAVDDVTLFVDDQHTIGVAVQRNADVGAHLPHLMDESARLSGTDFAVDIEAIGLDADRKDLRAKLPQRLGRDLVSCAVGAVDDDAQSFQREISRQGTLGEFDIAGLYALNSLRATEIS